MKILMTGATGHIGQELGLALVRAGHSIHALTRDPKKAPKKLPFPAVCFAWDGLEGPPPVEAFAGVDAIIHLVGEGIADARWTEARKKLLYDSRVRTTQNLIIGLRSAQVQPTVFISAAATGIYPSSAQLQDESATPGTGFVAELCQAWEKEVDTVKELVPACRVAHIRISPVLMPNAGFLRQVEPLFAAGLGARLGSGLQGFSFIHIKDLVRLFIRALEDINLSGAVNACAPNPTSNAELTQVLAHRLYRRAFLPAPKLALRVIYGELASLLFVDQRIISKKLSAEFFDFPTIEAALNDIYGGLKNGERLVQYQMWLPKSVDLLFPFFESAKNLEELTPSFLRFHVLRQSTPEITAGTLIDYRLQLHGIPFRWRTLIEKFEAPHEFVDTAVKGPFGKWHHTHQFESLAGGTLCTDRVIYRLPFGLVGEWGGGAWVRSDVDRIFSYRRDVLYKLFGRSDDGESRESVTQISS
jgi:uncharacterized protein (TIGR01777 family)